MKINAYAAMTAESPLTPFQIERRNARDEDVELEILYSGVCHSDLHQVRNEWGDSIYPMVPGHEIVGKVTKVGAKVRRFKAGDRAAVGVMIDSCRTCKQCKEKIEQYCAEGMTGTYNTYERDGKTIAQGGYSTHIVVDQRYVFTVAANLDLAGVAPLLCAGITTYSPLRFVNATKGQRVGVVGLGGLGHMAVKFAVAFGCEVTMLSTSRSKEADARKLGAHHFVLSNDESAIRKLNSSFDIVVNTISANHDYEPYLRLLDVNGKMLVVGLPGKNPEVNPFELIKNRRSIIGSMIGGTAETQEMLDFCGSRNIVADVEVIPMDYINKAYERMLKNDVKYRFVIDVASMQ